MASDDPPDALTALLGRAGALLDASPTGDALTKLADANPEASTLSDALLVSRDRETALRAELSALKAAQKKKDDEARKLRGELARATGKPAVRTRDVVDPEHGRRDIAAELRALASGRSVALPASGVIADGAQTQREKEARARARKKRVEQLTIPTRGANAHASSVLAVREKEAKRLREARAKHFERVKPAKLASSMGATLPARVDAQPSARAIRAKERPRRREDVDGAAGVARPLRPWRCNPSVDYDVNDPLSEQFRDFQRAMWAKSFATGEPGNGQGDGVTKNVKKKKQPWSDVDRAKYPSFKSWLRSHPDNFNARDAELRAAERVRAMDDKVAARKKQETEILAAAAKAGKTFDSAAEASAWAAAEAKALRDPAPMTDVDASNSKKKKTIAKRNRAGVAWNPDTDGEPPAELSPVDSNSNAEVVDAPPPTREEIVAAALAKMTANERTEARARASHGWAGDFSGAFVKGPQPGATHARGPKASWLEKPRDDAGEVVVDPDADADGPLAVEFIGPNAAELEYAALHPASKPWLDLEGKEHARRETEDRVEPGDASAAAARAKLVGMKPTDPGVVVAAKKVLECEFIGPLADEHAFLAVFPDEPSPLENPKPNPKPDESLPFDQTHGAAGLLELDLEFIGANKKELTFKALHPDEPYAPTPEPEEDEEEATKKLMAATKALVATFIGPNAKELTFKAQNPDAEYVPEEEGGPEDETAREEMWDPKRHAFDEPEPEKKKLVATFVGPNAKELTFKAKHPDLEYDPNAPGSDDDDDEGEDGEVEAAEKEEDEPSRVDEAALDDDVVFDATFEASATARRLAEEALREATDRGRPQLHQERSDDEADAEESNARESSATVDVSNPPEAALPAGLAPTPSLESRLRSAVDDKALAEFLTKTGAALPPALRAVCTGDEVAQLETIRRVLDAEAAVREGRTAVVPAGEARAVQAAAGLLLADRGAVESFARLKMHLVKGDAAASATRRAVEDGKEAAAAATAAAGREGGGGGGGDLNPWASPSKKDDDGSGSSPTREEIIAEGARLSSVAGGGDGADVDFKEEAAPLLDAVKGRVKDAFRS